MKRNKTTFQRLTSRLPLKRIQSELPRTLLQSALALLLSASTLAAAPQGSANLKPRIQPPPSKPYGQSYNDWAATYWQWLLSFPANESPAVEQGDVLYGAQDQSGPVWILESGNSGVWDRNLSVPPGKALLFSITGVEADTLGFPGASEQDLLDIVIAPLKELTITTFAEVDGVALQNIDAYLVTSPLFEITLPDPNLFGEPPGTGQALAEGWFFILAPLSKGVHTLHVAYHVAELPEIDGDTTYHVTVE